MKRRTSRARKIGAHAIPTIVEIEDCDANEENSSILITDENTENQKHRQCNESAKINKVQDLIQGKEASK